MKLEFRGNNDSNFDSLRIIFYYILRSSFTFASNLIYLKNTLIKFLILVLYFFQKKVLKINRIPEQICNFGRNNDNFVSLRNSCTLLRSSEYSFRK